MLIILCFDLFRCPAAQGLVEAFRVPPRDPPERRQLQVVHVLEGFALPDELGFVRAIDGLGHGVVVGVADRAGRGHHPVFQHPDGDTRGVRIPRVERAQPDVEHPPAPRRTREITVRVHACVLASWCPQLGVVTFCWTPVSLFFDYAMSPSSRLRLAMLVPNVSLIRSSRYQVMYPSSRSMNSFLLTPAKSRPWKNSCLRRPKNPSAAALSGEQCF